MRWQSAAAYLTKRVASMRFDSHFITTKLILLRALGVMGSVVLLPGGPTSSTKDSPAPIQEWSGFERQRCTGAGERGCKPEPVSTFIGGTRADFRGWWHWESSYPCGLSLFAAHASRRMGVPKR